MIKINKSDTTPKILIDNKGKWTSALIEAVKQYGGYAKIPKVQKEKLLQHYRHDDIQRELFKCSHNKCVFCECIPSEGGNIEVEHFAPKSIYHELTFEWDNLLPVCRKCNEAKSDYDTVTEPIVNPSKEDPEEYFTYNFLNLEPSSDTPSLKMSQTTIKVCNLNSTRLFKARADLLYNLSVYQEGLKSWLLEIENVDSTLKKKNRILKLIDSIDAIEMLGNKEEKYSAFCKAYLANSKAYKQAKIIDKFRGELQLTS